MRIHITIGDQRFQATLDDSATTRDLAAQLPLTLQMSDHGSVEKTGPLPSPLSLAGQSAVADSLDRALRQTGVYRMCNEAERRDSDEGDDGPDVVSDLV
jgi:Cyclophilin-like family